MRVFVSVGTTEFAALVEAVQSPEVASALERAGFSEGLLQVGRGAAPAPSWPEGEPRAIGGLRWTWYRFKPTIADDFGAADLVICHAGAGSILEALRGGPGGRGRPLIVVPNDALMDSHQTELADALAAGGHLVMAAPGTLAAAVEAGGWQALNPLPEPAGGGAFVAGVDSLFSFG